MIKSTIVKTLLLVFSLGLFIACSDDDGESLAYNELKFLDQTKIVFTTKENAKILMGTSDEFTQLLSKFDVQARTQDVNKIKEADYLNFAASNVKEWTTAEIATMKASITDAESKIKALNLKLNLPQVVNIIKSTTEEEGVADYTRLQFIVLKEAADLGTFLHELFHVYTRINPAKRDEIYETINFKPCNRISFPAFAQDYKMTNPDAPFLDHYINVTIDGNKEDVIFALYSKSDYSTGSFFDYLTQSLMVLEGNDTSKAPALDNGDLVLKDYSDATDLRNLIGINTDYDIHPEEICAEHFRLLIMGKTVPEPEYLTKLKTLLQ